MHVWSGSATDVGRRRTNEDAHAANDALGIYALADGLGGYDGGEVASQLAIDTVTAVLRAQRRSEACLEQRACAATEVANASIRRQQRGRQARMGTTLALLLAPPQQEPAAVGWCEAEPDAPEGLVAHVGDSRVYRWRAGELEQLTRDHSYVEHLRASGMHAPARYAHVLVRAVGRPDTQPDLRRVSFRTGDVFMLCSDGVSGVLPEGWIRKTLGLPRSPAELADILVSRAIGAGGSDNATAVVVRVG